MAWNDTLDNDQRAAAAAKGWDRLASSDEAAATIFKSYVNLEKTRPDPARTIVLPTDANDPAWANVYQRLGAPKDPSEYKFEGVTFKDGTVPEAPLFDLVKTMAAKFHLPVDAAKQLATDLVAYTDTHNETEAADLASRIAVGEGVLKGEWKDSYDTNVSVAARALQSLGLDKDVTDVLVEKLGVDKVMKIGYDLGQKMGEADLVKGDTDLANVNNGQPVQRTREEAMKERNRLTHDEEFRKKIVAGDTEALKIIETLTQQMVGTQDNWSSVPVGFGRTRDQKTGQMIENV